MSELETNRGRQITHCHYTQSGEIRDATEPRIIGRRKNFVLKSPKKEMIAQKIEQKFPGIERISLPTNEFNCHGKTFGNKECWINSIEVSSILLDNRYQSVFGSTRVGDLVLYRGIKGDITHTGFVHQVNDEGKPVLVQSKWGTLGDYLHAPDTVPPIYGNWTIYRQFKDKD